MIKAAALRKLRALIKEHGWSVNAVSGLGCECCEDASRTPHASGKDPFLYTAGLTAAGLPELLLTLPGKNTLEWINTAHRVLSNVARHGLHTELFIGQVIPVGIGDISATIAEPPPFTSNDVWPSGAFAIYGRGRVRFLHVVPNW